MKEKMNKLNYLLVMPRFVSKVGEWYPFPLGLPYVSASMKAAGFNVFTLNLNNEYGEINSLLEYEIIEKNIDAVLTGGIITEYYAIRDIVQIVKRINPKIITIAGGGIITASPIPSMTALEFCDFGVIGEGEKTACELCNSIENNLDVNKVEGLIFSIVSNQDKKEYIQTKPREAIKNLDELPFPDYAGFGVEKNIAQATSFYDMNDCGAVSILTSRSCPCLCTFCFHSTGNTYRQRSLDNVFAEIDHLYRAYHPKYIFILDEFFGSHIERVKEFCERIKPYGVKWSAQYRVNTFSEEAAKVLKESNCDMVGFGLESADNRILKSMRKGITIEQTEKAIQICEKYGLGIQGFFIFGDIEETIETAKTTLTWWKKHERLNIGLNFINTFPGTYLYKYAVKHGIIKDEVKFIKDGCPIINVSSMNSDEIKWIAEQINTLPLRNLEEPANISDIKINYEEGSVTFDYLCYRCNEKNHLENARLFYVRNFATCKQCGKRHKIPLFTEVRENIDANIKFLLNRNEKIAFWGMTDRFAYLAETMPILKNDSIYFIDKSPLKQGSELAGKTIYAPAILAAPAIAGGGGGRISTVIVAALSYWTMIKEEAEKESANVNTFSIVELCRRDFMEKFEDTGVPVKIRGRKLADG
jgi:radical SAM superfamily enzyme YgiQ (UPF0313 family)